VVDDPPPERALHTPRLLYRRRYRYRSDVTIHPLPEIHIPERISRTPWRKLSLWQAPLADLAGDVLFLDLDVVITGSIDAFFDYQPGRFCVAENWTQRGQKVGNTSGYWFHVGNDAYIFDDFNRDPEPILAKYRVEQPISPRKSATCAFGPTNGVSASSIRSCRCGR
jgi:hypothetical protein